jgi:hypothetical protein
MSVSRWSRIVLATALCNAERAEAIRMRLIPDVANPSTIALEKIITNQQILLKSLIDKRVYFSFELVTIRASFSKEPSLGGPLPQR